MIRMWGRVRSQLRRDDGATMVEYGFMVSLIAIAALIAVSAFGQGVLSLFELVVFP